MTELAPPRVPAVAGRFYPENAARLRGMVEQLLKPAAVPEPARLLMVPHAGYVYSGKVAGATYARTAVPESVLLMGPNHTGLGALRSLYSGGAWQTPLGDVPVAHELSRCLANHVDVEPDVVAHVSEHSLEVQLPFLQRLQPSLAVAALCFSRQSLSDCVHLGQQLAGALERFQHPVLIVCSSDMSHYVSAALAERLDSLALACIRKFDPEELYRTVEGNRISMCGVVPTTIGLVATRLLGAQRASVVAYGNSGETSGDFERVVGYAGAIAS